MEKPPKPRKLNVLPENPEPTAGPSVVASGRFPSWLHRKMAKGPNLAHTQQILNSNRLPTVCEEAKCPNLLQCWSQKTATFLALGAACTRACPFCDIDFSKNPKPLEIDEPERLAKSVQELGLKHVVITMVARDDLKDGGATQINQIVKKVREVNPGSTIELLTSDFEGDTDRLTIILQASPEIFNHNIETVRELTPKVRHRATYDRTLSVLRFMKENSHGMLIKSGFMVGLGETRDQVHETLRDLKNAGCDIVTIGQYLQPNRHKLQVKSFVTPEEFEAYSLYGRSIGIREVFAGPFVRSSFNAGIVYNKLKVIDESSRI